MVTLLKARFSGQHYHVQYSLDDPSIDFFDKYIDATSDSIRGKAIQRIANKLFITDKVSKKGFNSFHKVSFEEYEMTKREITIFKILQSIINRSSMNRDKLLEELSKLPKKEIEEKLIILKIIGGK